MTYKIIILALLFTLVNSVPTERVYSDFAVSFDINSLNSLRLGLYDCGALCDDVSELKLLC